MLSSIVRLQDNQFITRQAGRRRQPSQYLQSVTITSDLTSDLSSVYRVNHRTLAGSADAQGEDFLQNPLEVDQPGDGDQRGGRNLQTGAAESRPFINHPPPVHSQTLRWTARSTTERTVLRTAWTPLTPNPDHFPKQSLILPFGRKISRESQHLRKV